MTASGHDQAAFLPQAVADAWRRASPDRRFQYRMRWGPPAYVMGCIALVWSGFAWTLQRRGMDLWLGLFAAVYAPATLVAVATLLRWRAWVRMSAVVLDGDALVWSCGPRVGRLVLRPEVASKLLLDMRVDKATGNVVLVAPDAGAPPLYLHRLVAYMERADAFTERLLQCAGADPQATQRRGKRG